MASLVYLDHNSTTPVAAPVMEAMLPWFREHPANASSTHSAGRAAAAAVEQARAQVASALGAARTEIVFTSGATESNNLAIRGVDGRVVAPANEHKAVLDTVLAAAGANCSIIPVDSAGRVDLEALADALPGATLVSVMLANNETGVLQNVAAIATLAHETGCLIHTDATPAFGKIPFDVDSLGVDLASVSAHKVCGPKGVGALFVRRGTPLRSVMTGGGHERGVRSGTLNVPGIVGFGVAAKAIVELPARMEKMRSRASRLLEQLTAGAPPIETYSDHLTGLPNTLSVRFVGADGEAVMANCPTVAMSVGSACTSAVPEPSHVLVAMGVEPEAAFETLRLSIGYDTGEDDVDTAARAIVAAVHQVRALGR
jgi:cysteine desulfurase